MIKSAKQEFKKAMSEYRASLKASVKGGRDAFAKASDVGVQLVAGRLVYLCHFDAPYMRMPVSVKCALYINEKTGREISTFCTL
jgi:hypothetical protein